MGSLQEQLMKALVPTALAFIVLTGNPTIAGDVGGQVSGAAAYSAISVEAFALDGRDLASSQTKVLLSGSYIVEPGGAEFIGDENIRIGVLSDDAPREARSALVDCQRGIMDALFGLRGCRGMVIAGHAVACKLTSITGWHSPYCLSVENAVHEEP
jgi:hypothetical protein